jgi:hypothetical protein
MLSEGEFMSSCLSGDKDTATICFRAAGQWAVEKARKNIYAGQVIEDQGRVAA